MNMLRYLPLCEREADGPCAVEHVACCKRVASLRLPIQSSCELESGVQKSGERTFPVGHVYMCVRRSCRPPSAVDQTTPSTRYIERVAYIKSLKT
jgi:hypothetical protein